MQKVAFSKLHQKLFSESEIDWLEKYSPGIEALCSGARKPKTKEQEKFIAVAKGDRYPFNDYQRLWLRHKEIERCGSLAAALEILSEVILQLCKKHPNQSIDLIENDCINAIKNPEKLRNLAEIYLKNESFHPHLAISLAEQASTLGDGESSYIIGLIYEHGLGVPENTPEAIVWYELASKRGSSNAIEKLKQYQHFGKVHGFDIGTGCSKTPVLGSGYDAAADSR